jgi:TetR/AcrR family transcriptional regulator, regulator of autoinduction and epiphytic fitness
VLDAGVEEFLANGYAGATLEAIARRAEVSTATVFKHFRTKADIFGAIMSRVFGNEAGQDIPMPVAGDPKAGLIALGLHYADAIRIPNIRALFRVMIAEVPRFPELGKQLYEKGKAPYLERLHSYLKSEVKAGMLTIADVPLAARQFLGMINDVVFWPHMLIIDLEVSDREAKRIVLQAVNTMLRAYGRTS